MPSSTQHRDSCARRSATSVHPSTTPSTSARSASLPACGSRSASASVISASSRPVSRCLPPRTPRPGCRNPLPRFAGSYCRRRLHVSGRIAAAARHCEHDDDQSSDHGEATRAQIVGHRSNPPSRLSRDGTPALDTPAAERIRSRHVLCSAPPGSVGSAIVAILWRGFELCPRRAGFRVRQMPELTKESRRSLWAPVDAGLRRTCSAQRWNLQAMANNHVERVAVLVR